MKKLELEDPKDIVSGDATPSATSARMASYLIGTEINGAIEIAHVVPEDDPERYGRIAYTTYLATKARKMEEEILLRKVSTMQASLVYLLDRIDAMSAVDEQIKKASS
jgi:hypothetical protein